MNTRRNIICKLRLNEDEYNIFKSKAESYGGNVSVMIRDAVKRYDDKKVRSKIEAMTTLLNFYNEYQQRLSWFGGNFNQAMHRANEQAIAGELSQQYFQDVIMPQTKEAMIFLRIIKSELDEIHNNLEG